MGSTFHTYLVDPAWYQELVAAWKPREAGLPVPPVRWPDSEAKKYYLSHIFYEWPDVFVDRIVSRELPDGTYWFGELNELIEALAQTRARPELAFDSQTRAAVEALLRFAEPFMLYTHRHDDYGNTGNTLGHILSPATCAALAPLHAAIDFRAVEPVVTLCVRENAEQAPKKEYPDEPWWFSGRDANELLRTFCNHCLHCCQESCRTSWALGLTMC
jgi:hypothetical protein